MTMWTRLAAAAAAAAIVAGCGGEDSGEATGPAPVATGNAVPASFGDVAPSGAPAPAYAPGITVVGIGRASAVPDTAQWSFGVQVEAETASAALRDASAATKRIVAAMRGGGIERQDIRTEQVSIYPRTSDDGRSVIGYSASSSVGVTVRDLDEAGRLVDAAVAAGGNQVSGPALSVSDTREAYRTAAKAALADARARAEALAAEAGLALGAPIAVVESAGGYPGPLYQRTLAAEDAAAIGIEPGVDEITASLTVTYAIG